MSRGVAASERVQKFLKQLIFSCYLFLSSTNVFRMSCDLIIFTIKSFKCLTLFMLKVGEFNQLLQPQQFYFYLSLSLFLICSSKFIRSSSSIIIKAYLVELRERRLGERTTRSERRDETAELNEREIERRATL